MATTKPMDTDAYIAGFPKETQALLKQVRTAIREIIPGAEEMISYGIPAFKMNGSYVVYYSGYKHHLSLYPVPKGSEALAKSLAPYKAGKGTLQFKLDQPLPMPLIVRVVKALLKDNINRTKAKKK